ncbi:MAG: SNF2-related protein, partial [Longimicrobiales bacterium]
MVEPLESLTMEALHAVHRRYYAEELVRLRRAGEGRRYAASQRQGRIDPNPHQVEAVMFALGRIPMGGCILADEVGLGKTIEAGLVIAQLLAEGASRVLIIVPLALLGQWQSELYTLFGIEAQEASSDGVDISGPGVFLAGREYAGGRTGAERLGGSPPFDLCVIDEAHEVFA